MLPGQMPDLLSDRVRLHVIHGGNGGGNGREESRMRFCCGSRRRGSCRRITAVLKTGQRMCCLNSYWGPFLVLRLKARSQLRPVLTRLNCCRCRLPVCPQTIAAHMAAPIRVQLLQK